MTFRSVFNSQFGFWLITQLHEYIFVCLSQCHPFSLIMPLVCKDMVDILDTGVNSTSANHTSLSNFAFLYGVFPTAPSVAIYAGHYNMELEVVCSLNVTIIL